MVETYLTNKQRSRICYIQTPFKPSPVSQLSQKGEKINMTWFFYEFHKKTDINSGINCNLSYSAISGCSADGGVKKTHIQQNA